MTDNIYLLCVLICTQICVATLQSNAEDFDAILIVTLKILKPIGNN